MRPRQPAGAAVLLLAALLLAACSPATAPSGSRLAPGSPGLDAPSSTPAAASSAASPSGRLAAALAAMDGGYTYTATVTVGASAVSTARGRSVGGSSEFVLTSNGASVTYRAIPPRAWVEQPGGAWVAVSGKVPAGSPIAALAGPTGIAVVADDAKGLALDASYPPAALGLGGSKPVTVRLLVAPDGTVTAIYRTAVGTDAASSTSVFTPASGLAPITAPPQ